MLTNSSSSLVGFDFWFSWCAATVQYSRVVVSRIKKGGTSTYYGKGEVMVDSLEQLITVGIWEYQRIQGTKKWWLLRPSNLLWRRWGSVIWLLTSHYYCGATTGVNLSLKLCCALNIAAWQVEPDEGCPTCRWNEVELFLALLSILQDLFICTHNFDEIVLWCYEGFNSGSRGKKRFQLRIHVSCLEIILLQHSIKYKWNYHG